MDLPGTPASDLDGHRDDENPRFYVQQIQSMPEFKQTTLYIDFKHLMDREETLSVAIQDQYYR